MFEQRKSGVGGIYVRLVSVVCVCLVLLLAGAQATHLHLAGTGPDNHDCSVCSVIHAGAVVTVTYQVTPLFARSLAAPTKDPSPETLLLVRAAYIRPPPSV
jgi:hypothetical protein